MFFRRGLGDYCDAFEEGDYVDIDNVTGSAVLYVQIFCSMLVEVQIFQTVFKFFAVHKNKVTSRRKRLQS